MEEEKIRAIADLVGEGNRLAKAGAKREAVQAFASAYKDAQEALVALHALWVNAYEEMVSAADEPPPETAVEAAPAEDENEGSNGQIESLDARNQTPGDETSAVEAIEESAAPQPAEAQEVSQTETAPPQTTAPQIIGLAEREASEERSVIAVAAEDVDEGSSPIKRLTTNPFAQAARDLAAAVVEAASDVAAAVVDVRTKSLGRDERVDETSSERRPSSESESEPEAAPASDLISESEPESMLAADENPADASSEQYDAQLQVLQNLLEQVRERRNP